MKTKKSDIKTKTKKKKGKSPVTKAVDNVYNAVLTGNYQATTERMATAHALITLRSIELHKNDELESMLYIAYKEYREKIVKLILTAVLTNNLRLVDSQIMIEMIKNEIAMISAWEYEHLDEADEIIIPLTDEGEAPKPLKTLELFKALGTVDTDKEDDDT